MTIKKSFAALAAVGTFFAFVTCVMAQDDLDNLLSDLEGGDKKAAPAEAKPAAEEKPAEKKPDEEGSS